jgi:hypothetical protein
MNVCRSTVNRPFESAAYWVNGSKTQFVAAAMPRFGSVWDESVCSSSWLEEWDVDAMTRFRRF